MSECFLQICIQRGFWIINLFYDGLIINIQYIFRNRLRIINKDSSIMEFWIVDCKICFRCMLYITRSGFRVIFAVNYKNRVGT